MRVLSKAELDLVAGGTTSSDYYPGSSGEWYENGGGSGGGGSYSGGMWIQYGGYTYAGPEGPVIVGTTWAYYSWNSGGGGTYVGGLGGGGGQVAVHEYEFHEEDAPCENEAAMNVSEGIQGLVGTEGNFEFTGLLTSNSDGTYGLLNDQLTSLHNEDFSSFANLGDYSDIYGFIHNHPFNDSNYNANFLNQYPSDRDWEALDLMAANGADPTHLSVFILDPFGVLREFQYSDKATYQAMTDTQRYQSQSLPQPTTACQSSGG